MSWRLRWIRRRTDYFVSSARPVEVKVDTPHGTLVVNGRFGAVSVRDGKVKASKLVEGTLLTLDGRQLNGN